MDQHLTLGWNWKYSSFIMPKTHNFLDLLICLTHPSFTLSPHLSFSLCYYSTLCPRNYFVMSNQVVSVSELVYLFVPIRLTNHIWAYLLWTLYLTNDSLVLWSSTLKCQIQLQWLNSHKKFQKYAVFYLYHLNFLILSYPISMSIYRTNSLEIIFLYQFFFLALMSLIQWNVPFSKKKKGSGRYV